MGAVNSTHIFDIYTSMYIKNTTIILALENKMSNDSKCLRALGKQTFLGRNFDVPFVSYKTFIVRSL